ncbi:MAG: beta-lactamase family protein [Flavobacteriales bacterium]|jgi:CubicO group peptidase (beta-lactamase class C family)|nr:beta-lactamase family protein [Flavobacteriales bacterium]MBK7246867.1 beta-lactamase family protein [Flavobacteriales bacterium]MBK7287236.1 beta-lactamase family protein [Flavobacteriales bacterium]MBK9061457.1 beta-lactamase family protein [Flavobacteriales bacterium]QQS72539.1 MAG: beta-lactamase family protein [Flavobacteriales bacterium]
MASPDVLLGTWAKHSTPGVAYLHFDRVQVLHQHYAGLAEVSTQRPVDASTSFHGFSVTKTMTALAVVQLAQAGHVDLDAPVREHLPGIPCSGDIRIRHLLNHTAGLPNPLPLSWVHVPTEADFDRDAFFAAVFAKHPKLRSKPGARFAYSNLGYVLLGQLIERVTGQRYEEIVRRGIFDPSGIAPDELGFQYPTNGAHATGYLRTPGLLPLLLPFMLDTKRYMGERVGRWRPFKPFLLNGASYGGSLGTAHGYRKYLQALLTPNKLVNDRWREQLFTENLDAAGRRTGMAMGWFTGSLKGHAFLAHAGGGGGYYAELRLYPAIGKGSVVLFNRTGIRDERVLDELDAPLVPG